ncbi:MAG: hypothetical protein IH822_02320, partial [Chloroflexi bacterium]|nr:hypothetical protein [Chloroflexota bacterium]
MKENDSQAWDQAVEVDEMIRAGVRGTKQKLYLHRSLKPLAEADLSRIEAGRRTLDEDDGGEGVVRKVCDELKGSMKAADFEISASGPSEVVCNDDGECLYARVNTADTLRLNTDSIGGLLDPVKETLPPAAGHL